MQKPTQRHFASVPKPPRRSARTVREVARIAQTLVKPGLRRHDARELAASAHFSVSHFRALFRTLHGESMGATAKRLRLDRAAFELRHEQRPLVSVALRAGYRCSEAFTRAFRARFGVSPRRLALGNPPQQSAVALGLALAAACQRQPQHETRQ
jgi:AraC-like DNA-binding protein